MSAARPVPSVPEEAQTESARLQPETGRPVANGRTRLIQPALTALCGLTLVPSLIQEWTGARIHPWLPYASVAFGAYFAIRAAYRALLRREVDVNVLMLLAAVGAIIVHRITDAAVLLFLFSLSNTLESLAMARTRSAIEGLIKLRPERAIRVNDAGDEVVPTLQLRVGDRVRVLPFEQVPIDGIVVEGQGEVNEAIMTGESVPAPKSPGATLLAGTQNLDSMLVIRVSSPPHDTTLEKIVRLVSEAQEHKASGERISAWFGQRYTLFVLAAFLMSFGVRVMVGEPVGTAFYAALILLVALSPCALVISVPASTLSALAWCANRGILVRGGEFIETAARVDLVALDKTGTLTTGRPQLAEICVCKHAPVAAGVSEGSPCQEDHGCWLGGAEMGNEAKAVLRIAAGAEQYSTHPIAEAIVSAARAQNLDLPHGAEHRVWSGLGVEATIEGAIVRVGQRRFFESDGATLPPEFIPHAERMQRQGMTVVVVHWNGHYAALGLSDLPRPEAADLVRDLRSLGVRRVVMITGDNPETAHAVARQIGVDEVFAGLMPQEKSALIRQWNREGRTVMMVGDGVNDAPSLAEAAVGVAMGGLGSDIALNAADVVLVHDRLERIVEFMRLGARTRRIIRWNLLFGGGVVVTLTVLSVVIALPLPVAVIGHEGSTVIVILNGLRLLRGPGNAPQPLANSAGA